MVRKTGYWAGLALFFLMQTLSLSDGRHSCFKVYRNGACHRKIRRTMPTAEDCCSRPNITASFPRVERVGKKGYQCIPCHSNTSAVVDGQWGSWSDYQACSVTCGAGVRSRERRCDNPAPSGGGQPCSNATDTEIQEVICNQRSCPVDGHWGSWGCWQDCNTPCGGGQQTRERDCDNPPPSHQGKECKGQSVQERPCNTHKCPVHGGWDSWLEWFPCSHTCGGGHHTRVRLCDNPRPQNGGHYCRGDNQQVEACNTKFCPVDGVWNHWSAFSACSVTCDLGTKISRRNCHGPLHGGAPCKGQRSRSRECYLRACAIDGGWSDWSAWSDCSVTCESGERIRTRSCDNPRPENGGKPCSGRDKDVEECQTQVTHCPIHGGWSTWTPWRSCSARRCSPAPGYHVRVRYCKSPRPQYNGRNCMGPMSERESCFNNKGCKEDGGWCPWSTWGRCNAITLQQLRVRQCKCPEPKNGGAMCRNDRMTPSMTMADKPRACEVNQGGGSGCGGSGAGGSGDGAAGDDEDCVQGGSGSGSGPDEE